MENHKIELILLLKVNTPFWQLAIYSILIGAGVGMAMQNMVIALQNAIEMKDIAVATASNTFFRSIGSTIGVAIFGAIYSSTLTKSIASAMAPLAKQNAGNMPSPMQLRALQENPNLLFNGSVPAPIQHVILNSYTHAFHMVFLTAAPIVLVGFFFAIALKETPLRSGAAMQKAKEEAAGEAIA
mgnify:CR=1 FL=1